MNKKVETAIKSFKDLQHKSELKLREIHYIKDDIGKE